MIVASGGRYQRLAVDELERFEGAGVYYAATDMEARECTGAGVIVVGGGNSAGQAAIYLAQRGSRVTICIRGEDLTKRMSSYFIDRIDADPRIDLLTTTEVRILEGERHLERVTVEHTPTGALLVHDPLPFETSIAGVFAVGDVRHGSLERVAAAVGEGSSAVHSVHEHLASAG